MYLFCISTKILVRILLIGIGWPRIYIFSKRIPIWEWKIANNKGVEWCIRASQQNGCFTHTWLSPNTTTKYLNTTTEETISHCPFLQNMKKSRARFECGGLTFAREERSSLVNTRLLLFTRWSTGGRGKEGGRRAEVGGRRVESRERGEVAISKP